VNLVRALNPVNADAFGRESPFRSTDVPGAQPRRIFAAAAAGLMDFVSSAGGDPGALLFAVGLDDRSLDDPRAVLDLGDYCRLMEQAAQETRNGNFGLDYGLQFQPEKLGPIAELVLASPTVGMALENLARYFPFHQQVTETRLSVRGEWVQLDYRIIDGRIMSRRQDAELTMGMFLNILRRAFGPQWSPDTVHLEHPSPADSREHGSHFQAEVYFGQRTNGIVFRCRDLSRPMPGCDLAAMASVREELIRLTGGKGRLPLIEQVRGELRSRLCEGEPAIETVAEALGLARWTLQRRLADQGQSFASLLTSVRQQLALAYLREPHLSVLDVSSLLGYSETSAFSRAFAGWFNLSPSAVRTAVTAGCKVL
jgi:AraC-like DNA-binding protein